MLSRSRTVRTHANAILALTALTTTMLVPLAGSAAAAEDPRMIDRFPVAPGLEREVYEWSTIGGRNQLQVLRFGLDDERVGLKPELAGGKVPGRETVDGTLKRLGDEAVAATNGGFWLSAPDGEPEGLVVRDGRYISEPATQGAGPRSAFALFPGGSYAVGRPNFSGAVWMPSGKPIGIGGINRRPGAGELVVFTPDYDATTTTAPGAVEAVFDSGEVGVETLTSFQVSRVGGANQAIPAGGLVISATGAAADQISALRPGDLVTFDTRLGADWRTATQMLAAGPLIVENGAATSPSDWETEGFEAKVHNNQAGPRTIVGFTADKQVLMVTVDGRQPGYSVGITTAEAADLMLRLGAVDAVMMDGGGSTTMAVDGRVENSPCCDGPDSRRVADSLVLRSSVSTPDVSRLAGANRYATAAAAARQGWPQGAETALVASGRTFPDGLAGGPLAAKRGAPLLLTDPGFLPEDTARALRDLGTRRVTLLGGAAAVSPATEQAIRDLGIEVKRISGADRTATAAAVARELGAPTGRAILVSGGGFADALSATVPAVAANAPLLLTPRDVLSGATADVLAALQVKEVVIAGGPAAVSDAVVRDLQGRGIRVTRVSGPDRFATSAAIIRWAEANAGFTPTGVAVASGIDFPDALSGAPFSARAGVPVLLVDPHGIYRAPATQGWVNEHRVDAAYIFGGRGAVASWVAHELQAARTR